ncbi:P-loop ATPase, Sll1717 family [Adhaeribacter soli]|uniref:Uncharacterized protein n=1 Tax=Adhaeribacter soli TaxID=2607655 RepID=A0A5N1J4U8_9BACT|nr:hypothetical protein [Adhaeribacter soli]KAA9340109.1 hypothetical protein F0P94_07105 [Adhaeribacter soli]
MNAIKALLETDFGNPDGLYDPHLEEYFLDQNYWENIVKSKTYFVIGRKGTGKSAIYNWIKNRESEKGIIISNLSFRSFPFEKLLRLSDDDFTRPNQYQSIWKYIILSEFAKQIVLDQHTSKNTDDFKELVNFVEFRFGKNLQDLHSKITTRTDKTEVGLQFRGIGPKTTSERAVQLGDEIENISEINIRLEDLVLSNLNNSQRSYIVQFDQLDDNYTLYIDNKKYFESLISLFKIIYSLNSVIASYNPNAKVIAYIRSDIFYQFSSHDPDSAKFDFHTYYLNWAIVNKNDWINPPLLQLINNRIENSIDELSGKDSFSFIFNKTFIRLYENGKLIEPFKYIIHRTFHRPRDLVQFCIKTKEQAEKMNKLDYQTIKAAEKEYSAWLIDELKNEISPVIPSTETLFTLLRTLGTRKFSSNEFKEMFLLGRNKNINKSPEALLRYLYELGIIQNINTIDNRTELYSIIRNEKSSYEPRMKAILHSGLVKGLHTFRE